MEGIDNMDNLSSLSQSRCSNEKCPHEMLQNQNDYTMKE